MPFCRDSIGQRCLLFDALIKAYAICGKPKEAARAFFQLPELGFVPSAKSCNFFMDFLAKGGDLEMVMAVFDQMKKFGMRLDACTFAILIKAFCRAGQAEEALDVLNEMKDMGIKPDEITYLTYIEGMYNTGKSDLAYVFCCCKFSRRSVGRLWRA